MTWEIVLPALFIAWLTGYGVGLAHLRIKKIGQSF